MKTYVMTEQEKQAIKRVLFFAYRNTPGNQKTDEQISADVERDIRMIINNRRDKLAANVINRITDKINELLNSLPLDATYEAWAIEDENGTHYEIGFTLPRVRVRFRHG